MIIKLYKLPVVLGIFWMKVVHPLGLFLNPSFNIIKLGISHLGLLVNLFCQFLQLFQPEVNRKKIWNQNERWNIMNFHRCIFTRYMWNIFSILKAPSLEVTSCQLNVHFSLVKTLFVILKHTSFDFLYNLDAST